MRIQRWQVMTLLLLVSWFVLAWSLWVEYAAHEAAMGMGPVLDVYVWLFIRAGAQTLAAGVLAGSLIVGLGGLVWKRAPDSGGRSGATRTQNGTRVPVTTSGESGATRGANKKEQVDA